MTRAKFGHSPPDRLAGHVIDRPRLIGRLDAAGDAPITAVTGPPGSGKSVLLTQWIRLLDPGSWAWLTVDHRTCGAVEFSNALTYTLSHLEFAGAETPEGSGNSPNRVLIIDNVDEIGPDALPILQRLTGELPTHLRLVLSSRRPPRAALTARHRSDNVERISARDLAFTRDETTRLLSGLHGHRPASGDVTGVMDRTDGWATGVGVLARERSDALGDAEPSSSTRLRRPDPSMVDYFDREVLDPLDARSRHALRRASVPDGLDDAMCRSISGDDDLWQLLNRMAHDDAFVRPNGDHGLRLNPLLRDVLRHQLATTSAADVPGIHQRAADLYETRHDFASAIDHHLDAGRHDEALRLIRRLLAEMYEHGRMDVIGAWLERIPDAVVADSWSQLDLAVAHLVLGQEAKFAAAIERAEEILDHVPDPGAAYRLCLVKAGRDALRLRPLNVLHALDQGEVFAAEAMAAGDPRLRTLILAGREGSFRAAASAMLERFDDAAAALGPTSPATSRPTRLSRLASAAALSGVALAAGRLRDAQRWADDALALAAELGGAPDHDNLFEPRLVKASLLLERNRVDEALAALEPVMAVGERREGRYPFYGVNAVVQLARARTANGDIDGALDALDRCRTQSRDLSLLAVGWLAAQEARTLAAVGRFHEAWALRGDFSDLPSFVLLSASLAVHRGQVDHARALLDGVAISTPRMALQADLVRAIAADVEGDSALAAAHLSSAMVLGEREHFVRTIVESAPAADGLLRRLPTEPAGYVTKVRHAFVGQRSQSLPLAGGVQLTDREAQILRHLPTDLTNAQIARAMGISQNTLKSHLNNIYRKLGVSSRAEAVELGGAHRSPGTSRAGA